MNRFALLQLLPNFIHYSRAHHGVSERLNILLQIRINNEKCKVMHLDIKVTHAKYALLEVTLEKTVMGKIWGS